MNTSEVNTNIVFCENDCSISDLRKGKCICYNKAKEQIQENPSVYYCTKCGKGCKPEELTPRLNAQALCNKCLKLFEDE